MRGIWEGEEHHLWSSDSRPACRGICPLRSSRPVPWCTAVRVEGAELLTEESEMKAWWADYFEQLYQTDPPASELDVSGVTIPIAYSPINCESPLFVETQAVVNQLKGVKLLGSVASMLNLSRVVEMRYSCRSMQFRALFETQASSQLTGRGAFLSLSGMGRVITRTATATEG